MAWNASSNIHTPFGGRKHVMYETGSESIQNAPMNTEKLCLSPVDSAILPM